MMLIVISHMCIKKLQSCVIQTKNLTLSVIKSMADEEIWAQNIGAQVLSSPGVLKVNQMRGGSGR